MNGREGARERARERYIERESEKEWQGGHARERARERGEIATLLALQVTSLFGFRLVLAFRRP